MKRNILLYLLLSLFLCASGQSYDKSYNYVAERIFLNKEGTKYVDNVAYLDGFGRKVQETQVKASPGGTADLILPHTFGVLGRTEKEFLPYSRNNNNGSYDSIALNSDNWNTYGNADAAYAFTKTEYDNSPLDRVTKQTGAGAAWHTTGKGVTSAYALNTENEVRLYNVDLFTGTLSLDGSYNAGSLQKVTTTDEDGHSVETFTDNTDKTVLTVTVDGEKRLETYYVYDDREQLRWVLSPEASYQLGTTVDATLLNRLAYYYEYDRLGRMTLKRLPGCEPIYMVYDKRDRMVLSQDGNQRTADSKKWSYSVYDNNNRIVESGEMILSIANTHKQLQDAAWDSENYLPAGTKTPLQYTVYDSYEVMENVTAHPFVSVTGYASDYYMAVTGLVTSTKTRILETDTWLTATTYYDEKSHPIQTVSDNQHGQLSRVDTQYDFIGNVLKQRESHGVTANTTDVLETVNTYDDRSRLLTATSTLNGGTPAIVTYEYDVVGRLIKKQYDNHTTENLAYNIRGWLTSKESEPFKMKLHYESPVAGATACYNGNISEWEWQQGTNTAQLYGFTYDNVSRLKETNQYLHAGTTWSVSPNDYVEKGITYDRNGNILTLQRTGNGTLVDNLSYTYTGNQLTALQESVRTSLPEDIYQPGSAPNGTYEYDANGNMKKDSRKSLTFNYNALNLLSVVKENNAVKASYRYLADGTKTSVRNGNGNTGYDYEGSFVYTVTNNTPTLEAAHFVDGQLKATGVNYTLTDHLGSVRALVDANGTLLEQNDYYPFGSKHVNTSYASSDNRYTFSGKESQDLLDLNTYDFGARIYDGNTARWATVDPLCEDYYSLSLYNYCGSNPVINIDVVGTFASPYYDFSGNFLGVDEFGFTGDIYITKKETFYESSENGIANSKKIQAKEETLKFSAISSSLSSEALSNIYTDVLKHMSDIDFSRLYNGRISILEDVKGKNTRRGIDYIGIGYNFPYPIMNEAQYTTIDKEYNQISTTVNRPADLNTVESIQNYLGVHEYYGHGILGYKEVNKVHWKCYLLQIQHPTFKKLNKTQQKEIRDNYKKYRYIWEK